MPLRFRWASLQLEVLCSVNLDADIQGKLCQLPPKLEQLYAEIYKERIISYPGEAGRAILSNALEWLLCAQRSMDSSKFCTAVARISTVFSGDLTKEHVLDLCHNFVIHDDGLDTFRFVHLSVREFLEKRPNYSHYICHILAAEVCLVQLIDSSKCSAAESFIRKEYPIGILEKTASAAEAIPRGFHKYAMNNGMIHCQKSGENERICNVAFKKMLHFFLLDDSGVDSPLCTWMLWYRHRPRVAGASDYNRIGLKEYIGFTVCCYLLASALGFCEILRACSMGEGLITHERQLGVSQAVRNCQDEAFKQQLSNSEGFEAGPTRASSVLEYLSQETLVWLLDRSCDTILTDDLIYAAARKNNQVLALILERYKDSKITKEMLDTAVRSESRYAFELLLSRAEAGNISED